MIAILGGGVAGASLARALALRGRKDVVVFDPRPICSGSTAGAMGGFRTQHGSALNVALSLASRPYFERLAGRIGFRPDGYLYLADTQAAEIELRRRAELQRELGISIEHPDARRLVPFLELDGVLGANFCALDGLYEPPLVLAAMVEEAREHGVDFRYGTSAAPTALEAEQVVVASGIWSHEVGRSLGVELAVEPLERGVFKVGPFDWLPEHIPMTLEAGSGYHFRERDRRLCLMGPGDQADYGPFREWLSRRAPKAAVPEPEAHLSCHYEVTFDHHPLVGATGRHAVWADCGFSGHGVMHSPAIGESLAAMILGDTPPLDISPLSPLRKEPLQDVTQL